VTTGGRLRRSSILALTLMLIVAIAGWSSPGPVAPTADPSLALDAHNRVPAQVMTLLRRGCFDCHSNDTRWPWYSRVPPVSWLVLRDVERGRGQVNFSRWGQYNPFDRADILDKACDLASKREMPLWPYRLMHPEARLSDTDVATLCHWSRTEAARLVNGGT
jgi:hypothetical protein